MQVHVILHSILREKLPAEARGRATLDLAEGASLGDAILRLDLPAELICAVNEKVERDLAHPLQDGDLIRFLRPGAGG